MRRLLSRVFLGVPRRDLFSAKFSAVAGCVFVVLAVFVLAIRTHHDLASTLNSVIIFLLGLMQFVFAALFSLPDHRRRAKQWLRAAGLLVGLVGLVLATVVISVAL